MERNPREPLFQITLVILGSLELVAVFIGNDLLLVSGFILILVLAFFWMRYRRSLAFKSKYSPIETTPNEDWKGKTDKDNNPV